MFRAFERRIRKSVWIGHSGMSEFDVLVTCGIIQIEILGYYVILPLPMRLANKIEDAVAKRRIKRWNAERDKTALARDFTKWATKAKEVFENGTTWT